MATSLGRSRAPSFRCGAYVFTKITIVLALVSVISAPAIAANAEPAQPPGNTLAAKPDLFSQQAAQLRASTCAGLYAALGNGAVQGSAYQLRTEVDRAAPNAHAVKGTVGMTYNLPDAKGPAAALVTAAPVGGKCEGQFVRIVPFKTNCSQVLRDFPAGSERIGDLSGVPLYQLGSSGIQALTIPSGETCIVVSIVQGQQNL